jgi:hypothetical protein
MSATRGAIAVSGGARQPRDWGVLGSEEFADVRKMAGQLVAGGLTARIDGHLYMTGGVCELWHIREPVQVRNRRPQQVGAMCVDSEGRVVVIRDRSRTADVECERLKRIGVRHSRGTKSSECVHGPVSMKGELIGGHDDVHRERADAGATRRIAAQQSGKSESLSLRRGGLRRTGQSDQPSNGCRGNQQRACLLHTSPLHR